ncbi:MAG TPA: DedA family protein [Burkholderiales bacterium]|nr:DedA family protein [Burkholderiales bacterium]
MDLAQLVEDYGYWAVLAGTLLEGETVLLLAGFAAYQGLLDIQSVIGVAVLGGFLGDQVFFFAGRRYGERLLARFPRYAGPAARAKALLARYHLPVILGIRFMYGLRAILPFSIGTTQIGVLRFQTLNLIGAVLWACAVTGIGFLLGDAAEAILGRLEHLEGLLFLVLAAAGLAFWWLTRRRAQARPK